MKIKRSLVLITLSILLIIFVAGCDLIKGDFVEWGTVKGTIWEDQDRNGVITDGENRLAGVEVQLLNEDGEILKGAMTDSSGSYEFLDFTPKIWLIPWVGSIFNANYEIKVIPSPGKAFTEEGLRLWNMPVMSMLLGFPEYFQQTRNLSLSTLA